MRLIATHVDDTFALLRSKLEQEKGKPHRAIDPYFTDPMLFMSKNLST